MPYSDCYGCQGTGYLKGFVARTREVPCVCSTCHECGDHESELSDPLIEDEGIMWCQTCWNSHIGKAIQCAECGDWQGHCVCPGGVCEHAGPGHAKCPVDAARKEAAQ